MGNLVGDKLIRWMNWSSESSIPPSLSPRQSRLGISQRPPSQKGHRLYNVVSSVWEHVRNIVRQKFENYFV
jgi:hypothetical protein